MKTIKNNSLKDFGKLVGLTDISHLNYNNISPKTTKMNIKSYR